GIHLRQFANNNTLSHNIASRNTVDGISLHDSPRNTVLGNTADDNGEHGILLADNSHGNIVSENAVSGNTIGIRLSSSPRNILTQNTIEANRFYGLYVFNAWANTLVHNTFVVNHADVSPDYWEGSCRRWYKNPCPSPEAQAFDDYPFWVSEGILDPLGQPANIWDDLVSGGNFWSDASERGIVDAQDDGLGDTPYVIDASEGEEKLVDRKPILGSVLVARLEVRGLYPGLLVTVNSVPLPVDDGGNLKTELLLGSYDISVPSVEDVSPGIRIVFDMWSDGVAQATRTVDLESDIVLSVSWKTQHHLKVESKQGDPLGEGWYDEGSTATFSVSSPVGFLVQDVFVSWDGDVVSEDPSVDVIMDSPKTVRAIWRMDFSQLVLVMGALLGGIVVALVAVLRRQPSVGPTSH
ncbi:MAG: nitrous oxide reductase family maturation protein NosD, partial [Candidatus Geothermarchaeales archaeon]